MSNPKSIKPDSPLGRVLLALRPGSMEHAELKERVRCASNCLIRLGQMGMVTSDRGVYSLTEAGRAACPSRRDAQPSPLHASKSNMARQHGWSSAHKSKEAAR